MQKESTMVPWVTGRVLTARLRLLFKLGPPEAEVWIFSGLRSHKVITPEPSPVLSFDNKTINWSRPNWNIILISFSQ